MKSRNKVFIRCPNGWEHRYSDTILCSSQFRKWFSVPKKIKKITIKVADYEIPDSYQCKFIRIASTESTAAENYIYDSLSEQWQTVTLTAQTDCLLTSIFNNKPSKFYYWVAIYYNQ